MSKSITKVELDAIELCSYCDGHGELYGAEWLLGYIKYSNEEDMSRYTKNKCFNCDGKGRMRKITIIEYKQL